MSRILVVGLVVTLVACQGGLRDPGIPVPSGECHFEVANQMVVPISVTASGKAVRALGLIPPGGAVRFQEECDVGTVRFVAQIQESPPGLGPDGRPTTQDGLSFGERTEVRVAQPRPGSLVRVAFRGPRIRRF